MLNILFVLIVFITFCCYVAFICFLFYTILIVFALSCVYFITFFASDFFISFIKSVIHTILFDHMVFSPKAFTFVQNHYSMILQKNPELKETIIATLFQQELDYLSSVLINLNSIELFFVIITALLAYFHLVRLGYLYLNFNPFNVVGNLSFIDFGSFRNQKSLELLQFFFSQSLVNIDLLVNSVEINDYLIKTQINLLSLSDEEFFFCFLYYFVLSKNL